MAKKNYLFHIEIRDGDNCVAIIRLVQFTPHFSCDVITARYLDDEASCF